MGYQPGYKPDQITNIEYVLLTLVFVGIGIAGFFVAMAIHAEIVGGGW